LASITVTKRGEAALAPQRATPTIDSSTACFKAMPLTTDDRLAIYELIALHGHLMDSGAFRSAPRAFYRSRTPTEAWTSKTSQRKGGLCKIPAHRL
jgi:hypothetical protein